MISGQLIQFWATFVSDFFSPKKTKKQTFPIFFCFIFFHLISVSWNFEWITCFSNASQILFSPPPPPKKNKQKNAKHTHTHNCQGHQTMDIFSLLYTVCWFHTHAAVGEVMCYVCTKRSSYYFLHRVNYARLKFCNCQETPEVLRRTLEVSFIVPVTWDHCFVSFCVINLLSSVVKIMGGQNRSSLLFYLGMK